MLRVFSGKNQVSIENNYIVYVPTVVCSSSIIFLVIQWDGQDSYRTVFFLFMRMVTNFVRFPTFNLLFDTDAAPEAVKRKAVEGEVTEEAADETSPTPEKKSKVEEVAHENGGAEAEVVA